MKSFLAVFVMVAILAGCAKTVSTSLVTGEGPVAGRQFGKTAVLVWFAFETRDAKGKDKADKLREIVMARFAALPGASLDDADALARAVAPRAWRDASDVELLAAARGAGLDSVALVEVAACGGELGIGLTPLPVWSVVTRFSYRLRLLDVKTGTLVQSAMRGKESGGPYTVRGIDALLREFDADLASLLTFAPLQANLETH
ncbi:hypothetical protein [Solidesulfovibrio sp.]|uniref:hypothetical protein n=1 Tax=Solidesulfovibrio sp. TaxID=2910990 RepID=UPI002635A1FE|nr:hypothetical protein [Solidesulfovibrio sp.]